MKSDGVNYPYYTGGESNGIKDNDNYLSQERSSDSGMAETDSGTVDKRINSSAVV